MRHRSPSYKQRQERRRKLFLNKNEIQDTERNDCKEADKVSGMSLIACEDEIISTNGAEHENVDQAGEVCGLNTTDIKEEVFNCELCDFSSNWRNGLLLHVSSTHEIKNDKLKSSDDVIHFTQLYWKTGELVNNMEVYINALMDIEKAKNVNEAIKVEEERKIEQLWIDIQKSKSKS